MVYHVVSAEISPGKRQEAEQFVLKMAAYVNQRFPGANAHVIKNINGNQDNMHYVETFESMGAWEASEKDLETDADWLSLVGGGGGLAVPGSAKHNFYQILS